MWKYIHDIQSPEIQRVSGHFIPAVCHSLLLMTVWGKSEKNHDTMVSQFWEMWLRPLTRNVRDSHVIKRQQNDPLRIKTKQFSTSSKDLMWKTLHPRERKIGKYLHLFLTVDFWTLHGLRLIGKLSCLNTSSAPKDEQPQTPKASLIRQPTALATALF